MRSNPNGILFLGAGVILIALAYTDRGKAVWAAIKGQSSPATAAAKPTTGSKS